MEQAMESLEAKNLAFLKNRYIILQNSKALLINKDEENDEYGVIIEDPELINNDKYILLNKVEMGIFKKTMSKDFLKEDLPDLTFSSGKYSVLAHESEYASNLITNDNYKITIYDKEQLLASITVSVENDKDEVSEFYYDEVDNSGNKIRGSFREKFDSFLNKADYNAKTFYKNNGIELDFEMTRKQKLFHFIDYISEKKNGFRKFEEQLCHHYAQENRMKKNIVKKLKDKDLLIDDFMPKTNLKVGKIYKVLKDADLGFGKRIKMHDYYQAVKSSNGIYYFELMNIDKENKPKDRSVVFFGDDKKIKNILRESTKEEKLIVEKNLNEQRLDFGSEVVFDIDRKFKVNNKEIVVKKGTRAIVLDYERKVRLMILNEENNKMMLKDLYRSDVFLNTTLNNNTNDWLVLPHTVSREYHDQWIDNFPVVSSRLFYKSNCVGMINEDGSLAIENEYKARFEKYMNNIIDDTENDDLKNIDKEVKETLITDYMLNTQNFGKTLNQYLESKMEEDKKVKKLKI